MSVTAVLCVREITRIYVKSPGCISEAEYYNTDEIEIRSDSYFLFIPFFFFIVAMSVTKQLHQ